MVAVRVINLKFILEVEVIHTSASSTVAAVVKVLMVIFQLKCSDKAKYSGTWQSSGKSQWIGPSIAVSTVSAQHNTTGVGCNSTASHGLSRWQVSRQNASQSA